MGGGCAGANDPQGSGTARSFSWMVAGGPFASLVMTCVMGLVFLRFGTGDWDWIGSCSGLPQSTCFLWYPISSGIGKVRRRAAVDATHPAGRIQALDGGGSSSHRRLDRRAAARLGCSACRADAGWRPPRLSEAPFTRLMVCYRSMDLGDDAAAMEHLELALAGSARSGKVIRQCLFFEAAAVTALGRRNAQCSTYLAGAGIETEKASSAHGAGAAIAA